MKKLIVSLLFIGSCLITKAQTNPCKVDYLKLINIDSVYNIWGNSDATYIYFSDQIYNRYSAKLLELYHTSDLRIELEGDNWFDIHGFHIYTINKEIIHFTPCQLEDLIK